MSNDQTDRMSERPTQPEQKGLPADYRGATPEQVALAVLRSLKPSPKASRSNSKPTRLAR